MIKKQGDKWLVDVQPGGRGGRRVRKVFDTKAQAKSYELKLLSKASQ